MDVIKNKYIIFLIVPFVIYMSLLTVMPLMEPDETRYSAIPSEMNSSGDYVTPRLKGTVYLEKPPLSYWATAVSFILFGENEFSARLFPALCTWGCIFLVYFMGVSFHDNKTGLYAAAVLATSLYHFIMGSLNILDMPLTFFVSLATWCGYRYFSGTEETKRRLYFFYFFCALAFLTKGLIGILFPFAVTILWLLLSKRWRDIFKLFSPVGIVILLAVAGPWLVLVQKANNDFFWFFFIQEHFLRYTSDMHGKSETFFFYIPILIAGTLPWCAFLPKAIKENDTKTASLFRPAEKIFLLTWLGFILLFYSVSSSKLIPYVAPVFLPIAIFIGHIFRIHDDKITRPDHIRPAGIRYHVPIVFQSVLFIILLFVPAFLKGQGIPFQAWWPWVAFPVLLQATIAFLPDLIRKKWGRGYFITVFALSFLFMGSLVFPLSRFLTPFKSAVPIVKAVRDHLPAGSELYQFGISLYGIDFYGKLRTPIVDDIGELQDGAAKLPDAERSHFFLYSRDFFKLYHEKKDIYCVTKHTKLEKLKKEIPDIHVLWDNKEYYLIHLK
jgi:hypothetical protein